MSKTRAKVRAMQPLFRDQKLIIWCDEALTLTGGEK